MRRIKAAIVRLLPPALLTHLQAMDHYFNGEPEIRLLNHLVDGSRAAIDAGANIGTYSYFLRRHAKAVHAYEPNPDLAARLQRLMPDVVVRPVALSDALQELTFAVPLDKSGRLLHELGSVAQTFAGPVRQFRVKCVTIDSEAINDVGFIKIDVEQHEREVLRGALTTIRHCRPVILIEVYPLKYERSVPEEFSFLLRENYCAWFSFANRWYPLESFRRAVHAKRENFGKRGRFMGNNLVFFPLEHTLAKVGPTSERGAVNA
jgi:FkbM family methyltransferase